MGQRPVVVPSDSLPGRIIAMSRPVLFAVFVAGAVVVGELLTAGTSLLVVGQVRLNALVIGFAAGFATSAIAVAVLIRLLDRIRELQAQLEQSARTDELTGLPNRRYLFEVLTREIERARRRQAELAVVFVDIDRFKRVNDLHGHQVGDAVLREAAAAIKAALRAYDTVGRYGGEEFVMVLPDTGPFEGHAVAERIRESVAASVFAGKVRLTISLGIANLGEGMDVDRLLTAADTAVLRAKETGRNRSEVSPAQP